MGGAASARDAKEWTTGSSTRVEERRPNAASVAPAETDAGPPTPGAQAYHSSLNILEREMLMISTYLDNLSTQAALIAGFVFATFAPVDGAGMPLRMCYYGSASLTFGWRPAR